MQLDQLLQNTSYSQGSNVHIQPFDLEILRDAFQLKETAPVELPPVRIMMCKLLFLQFNETNSSPIM